MRNDVLIGIIITLLNEGKCSYSYLAEKYEVSKKTIQRYMEVIEMAGVPTISHFGRYGGTEITSSFNLENNFFTKRELARLLTHLHASPLKSLDNLDQEIKEKLELSLKSKTPNAPCDNFIIDYTSWGNTKPTSPLIKFLAERLNENKTYKITYIAPSSVITTRVISPYKLVFKDFRWYLLAFCHKRKEIRIFKLSRIQELLPSTEDFISLSLTEEEILDHLNNFFKSVQLELKVHPSVLPDVEEWLTNTTFPQSSNPDETILVHGTANLSTTLIDKLISYSEFVTVIKPTEVISQIKHKCKLISKKYTH